MEKSSAPVSFGRFNFESVKEFVYLGTQVNNTNNTREEISRRIASANRCLFGLSAIIRSKLTSKNTKLMIYKTLIIQVLMYGSEAWTLKKVEQGMLNVFERKVLRPVNINGEWRIRFNDELYSIYKDATIVRKISHSLRKTYFTFIITGNQAVSDSSPL